MECRDDNRSPCKHITADLSKERHNVLVHLQTVTVVYIPLPASMEASFQKIVVVWYQILAYGKVCVCVGVSS